MNVEKLVLWESSCTPSLNQASPLNGTTVGLIIFFTIDSQLTKVRSFFTICVTEFVNDNCLMWLQVQTFFRLLQDSFGLADGWAVFYGKRADGK